MSRKSRTGSSPSVVEKLIEQRRLIQEWLLKLEGTKAEMPAHVVERVRNDYSARLAGVTTELGEHADSVRQSLTEAQSRHDDLEKEQTAKRDELAELRLRRQVGELDDGRFKDQSQRLKSEVDDLAKELSNSLRDIDRLEEILDVMGRGDSAAAEPAAEEEEEEDVEVEPVTAEPPPPEPPPLPPPPPAPPAEKPKQDEMSFLRSVTGVITAQKAPPPKPKEPEEKPFFVREQEPEVPPEAEPPKPERKSGRGSTGTKPAEGKEGERTLACGECGALNLPTEWYCEKCGAELSAF